MPLKSGIARIAYKNNVPCQIIIISNKDKVMNEKKLQIKDIRITHTKTSQNKQEIKTCYI